LILMLDDGYLCIDTGIAVCGVGIAWSDSGKGE
jgi:hypothetical protein